MVPEEFFEAFVLGNYDDFKKNPDCVRRAFNAAVAASHLADHYLSFYKHKSPERVKMYEKIGDYVEHISKSTKNYFRDIRSIANAYKHLYTGKEERYAKHSSISSAGTIESIQFVGEELENISEEFAELNTSKNVVVYTRKSEEQLQFKTALNVVIDFWQKELFGAND